MQRLQQGNEHQRERQGGQLLAIGTLSGPVLGRSLLDTRFGECTQKDHRRAGDDSGTSGRSRSGQRGRHDSARWPVSVEISFTERSLPLVPVEFCLPFAVTAADAAAANAATYWCYGLLVVSILPFITVTIFIARRFKSRDNCNRRLVDDRFVRAG